MAGVNTLLTRILVELKSREAVAAGLLLLLIFVLDFSQRLWVSSTQMEPRQWSVGEPVELAEQFTMVKTVETWIEPYLPKSKPEPEPAKPAEQKQPRQPTPEEQLAELVEKGAHQIGADVVYLRGVLIEEKKYALLTLVDRSMKPRFKSLTLNESLGDYKLVEVTPKGILLKAPSDSISMKLFNNTSKNKETR